MSNINSLKRPELIELVNKLKAENEVWKELVEHMKSTNGRLEKLERVQNLNLQYQRRDTVEISGIPQGVKQEELEREVIKIFSTAGVSVHGKELDYKNIQACHRIGRKGETTICKFTNRKFAREGIMCGKNLKDATIYGENSKVYINHSLCDEFRHLNYLVRKAKRDNKIFRYRVKNGVNFIKLQEDGDFKEISHKNDLINMDLVID